jgi:hypothetical protein
MHLLYTKNQFYNRPPLATDLITPPFPETSQRTGALLFPFSAACPHPTRHAAALTPLTPVN